MENIHVLPTDKPSRLKQNKITKKYSLVTKGIDLTMYTPQNIYITDDSEIKEGDFLIHTVTLNIYQHYSSESNLRQELKKIILTTNLDLIKDGVQAIDDEFLEWFVKNPSCEEVEVKKFFGFAEDYLIIIPKEELERGITITHVGKGESNPFELPKALPDDVFYKSLEPKQETPEEVAERLYPGVDRQIDRMLFINGVKWQQQKDKNKYSDEEVKEILKLRLKWFGISLDEFEDNKWFEQFKNK